VAERARLESVCTGNRTAGSNPALSAIGRSGMPRVRTGACVCDAQWRGLVRTRAGWWGGCFGVGRVRPRGGWVGGERDAGWGACDRAARRRGGKCHVRCGRADWCSRNPALSAMSFGDGGQLDHRGKQGARVPRDGAPRTSSGPEGSSDKGNAPGAAVPPSSLLRHAGVRPGREVRDPGSECDGGSGRAEPRFRPVFLLLGPPSPDPGARTGGWA
jgi:hypothetical protein